MDSEYMFGNKYILSLFCVISFHCIGQHNHIRFGGNYNVDLWRPLSEQGGAFQDSTGNVFSNTYDFNLQSEVLIKGKWHTSVGVAYRRLNYRVKDRIYIYNFSYTKYGQGNSITYFGTRVFDDPADLVATSTTLGFTLEEYYNIFDRSNFKGYVGLITNTYVHEDYKADYYSTDYEEGDRPESFPHPQKGPVKKFFLSSMNVGAFYRMTWSTIDAVNLGLKVGVSSNVYSDWDEFKKYIWLHVGLELGFSFSKNQPENPAP